MSFHAKICTRESAQVRLSNGSVLVLFRLTGGVQLWQARSDDNGKTWSTPTAARGCAGVGHDPTGVRVSRSVATQTGCVADGAFLSLSLSLCVIYLMLTQHDDTLLIHAVNFWRLFDSR